MVTPWLCSQELLQAVWDHMDAGYQTQLSAYMANTLPAVWILSFKIRLFGGFFECELFIYFSILGI